MKVLCIDTSKKEAMIALLLDDKDCIVKMPDTMKHSESLMNYIEKVLTDNNVDVDDLDAIASVVGPGSFTGIRVGMSVVKAMTYATKKDIIASNVFEIVSHKVKTGYFILNSTMSTIYYGKLKNGKLIDTGYIKKEDFSSIVDDSKVYAILNEQSLVERAYKDIEYIDNVDMLTIENVRKKYETKSFTKDKDFTPLYIQLSQAEENLKVKNEK